MNIFDIAGIASKIPFELVQKLEADIPKIQRLQVLLQQAEPHINALIPIEKEAQGIYDTLSPDIMNLLGALK
jgi:hypothetical protein